MLFATTYRGFPPIAPRLAKRHKAPQFDPDQGKPYQKPVNQVEECARLPEAAMRLFFLIFTLAATALAGIGVTAVSRRRHGRLGAIVISAAIRTGSPCPRMGSRKEDTDALISRGRRPVLASPP